jgi:tetratricopeptide (TPR) repeat protein
MKNIVYSMVLAAASLAAAAQEFSEGGDIFNNAVILKEQKKYDNAATEFERVIAMADGSKDAKISSIAGKARKQAVNCRILAANVMFEIGAYDEAIESLENAKNSAQFYKDAANKKVIDEAMPRMLLARGINAMDAGNVEEAMSFFERSVKLDSNQYNALLALGACYMSPRMGNAQAAIKYYERAMRAAAALHKTNEGEQARRAVASYLLSFGQDAKSAGNYDAAYKNFAMLTTFDPQNAEGYLQMAVAANHGKKYNDAIAAGEKGIIIEKRMMQNSQIAYQLAYAYEQNSPPSRVKACEFYTQAQRTTDPAIKQNAKDAVMRLQCGVR